MLSTPTRWTEADRLEAVRSFDMLGEEPGGAYQQIVQRAADAFQTQSAAITLMDVDEQWLMARVGIPFRSTPRAWAFCERCFNHTSLLVVPDASADPCFARNPLVINEPRIRFYAGVAVRTRCGIPLGGLCVFDPVARSEPPPDRLAMLLRVLADQLGDLLEASRLESLIGLLLRETTSAEGAAMPSWAARYRESDPPTGSLTPKRIESPPATPLTPQQTRVLAWAARGKSAPEIAQILELTPRTVRFHLAEACLRLGAVRTSQAIALALGRGLLLTSA